MTLTSLDARPARIDRALLPDLPDRTLSPTELRRWVDAFVVRTQLWEHAVAHDAGGRHFASLYRDSHIDVWLLCWNVVDDTGWHDHDISSGAVAVTRGVIREGLLQVGAEPQERSVPAGTSFGFGPEHIHRVSGDVDGSVSVHAYSPPLWRLGQYSLTPSGVLQRTSVSYADELRPF